MTKAPFSLANSDDQRLLGYQPVLRHLVLGIEAQFANAVVPQGGATHLKNRGVWRDLPKNGSLRRLADGCFFTLAFLPILFFFLTGLEMLFDEPNRLNRLNQELALRRGWPTATGRVVTSQVEARKVHRRSRKLDSPSIVYTYVVAGEEFRCSQLGILGDEPEWFGDGARPLVASHPVGSEVTVHYDPKQPGRCFIMDTVQVSGTRGGGWVFVLVSLGFGALFWHCWKNSF